MSIIESIRQKRKLIVILGAITAIGIVGYAIFYMFTHAGKVELEISLAPSDATLTINNKPQNGGTVFLSPGKYVIKAEKNGYRPYEEIITLERGQRKTTIPVTLIYASEEAFLDTKNRQDEFLKNEGLGSIRAQREGEEFREKNSIVQKLPYKTLLYSIGYQADRSDPSGNSIIITVDAPAGLRDDVVAEIERWGYDPTELNILFRSYENPFDEESHYHSG